MNQNSNFGDVLVCHWYAPVLSEPILPSTVICFPGRSATLIKHIKLKLPTSPNILFRSLFLAPFTSFRACECRPDHPAGTSPIRERRVENWGSAQGLRGHAAMAPRPSIREGWQGWAYAATERLYIGSYWILKAEDCMWMILWYAASLARPVGSIRCPCAQPNQQKTNRNWCWAHANGHMVATQNRNGAAVECSGMKSLHTNNLLDRLH